MIRRDNVQYNTIHHNTPHYNATRYTTIHCTTVPYDATLDMIQHITIYYDTIHHNTNQYDTPHHNPTQYTIIYRYIDECMVFEQYMYNIQLLVIHKCTLYTECSVIKKI